MKKSCLGCSALNNSFKHCFLGYKTATYDILGVPSGVKPLEECPKPRTIKEFIELSNKRN